MWRDLAFNSLGYTISRIALSLPKWILKRWALRREQLCSILRDVHAVFQADPELSTDINPWFVAETHSRSQRQSVAPNQVWPLMPVHANAVAQAVAEVFIVGAVTGVGNYFARGRVYRLALGAGLGRRQRGLLRPMHNLKILLHLVSGFSQHHGPADV